MSFVCVNLGTGSTVSHTESMGAEATTMLWETELEAKMHARELTLEYRMSHSHLAERDRTWYTREATPKEHSIGMSVGAFGREYESIIGTGQSRAHIKNPEKIKDVHDEIIRREMKQYE